MSQRITFHFEGSLADDHALNFYEAARFQYAAARLIVKLEQFRSKGSFVQKITNNSNQEILLQTQRDGSFDITVLVPILNAAKDSFLHVSIPNLMSYVFERIIGKTSDSDVAKALNTQDKVVEEFGRISENNTEILGKALDIIAKDQDTKDRMSREMTDVLSRRIAELTREKELQSSQVEIARIDTVREQRLIAMSAPLVSEMATALRRSADTLEVISDDDTSAPNNILFLNRAMATEIELSTVDKDITPILVDIIQYNKETGWGKARMKEVQSLLSFNVPSDMKSRIQPMLLSAMDRDKVYIQTYIVRNKVREPTRLIIVGILPLPPA